MDPWSCLLDEIRTEKERAEDALGFPRIAARFEEPPEGRGDVGFDAFQYSKALKRSPVEVAAELSKAMRPVQLVSS